MELTASNEEGTTTAQASGRIHPLTDLRGQTQKNVDNTGHVGEIIVGDAQGTQLDLIETDQEGTFSKQLDDQLSDYLITAYLLDENGNRTKYGVELPTNISQGQDIDLGEIRIIHTPRLEQNGIDLNKFRNDVIEVLDDKVQRWDDSNIYITETSPIKEDGKNTGRFSSSEQEDIRQIAENPNQLGKLTEYNVNVVVGNDDDPDKPYTQNQDGSINIEDGWVVVYSDNTIRGGVGPNNDTNGDGIIDIGLVGLNTTKLKEINAWKDIILHEFGHVYGHENHSIYPKDKSIMVSGIHPGAPGIIQYIDEERSHIINEPTYTNKQVLEILVKEGN